MGGIFAQSQKVRYIPKNKKTEEGVQSRVCSYLRKHYPHVTFRSDYASGLKLTPNQARKHRSLQSCRAWPDLFIYAPNGRYHGMALELKKEGTAIIVTKGPRKGHLVSDLHIQEQAAMLKELKRLGYYANFAIGYDQAIYLIDNYFGRSQAENMKIF